MGKNTIVFVGATKVKEHAKSNNVITNSSSIGKTGPHKMQRGKIISSYRSICS